MDVSRMKMLPRIGSYQVPAARIVDGVLVDPENPPGDGSHERRTRKELLTWWRLPYIVTRNDKYDVRVLWEGAHDRTSSLGWYHAIEDAVAAAKAFHDEAIMVGIIE